MQWGDGMNNHKSTNISTIISKQSNCTTVYESDRCNIDLIYFKLCGSYYERIREKKQLNVVHSHSVYEFHLVLDGKMETMLEDGRTLSVEKNQFIIIPPSMKHSITQESEDFKKILISFELNAVRNDNDDFYVSTIRAMKTPVPYKCSARLTKLFNVMLDIKKSDIHDKNNMLFELAVCYIIEICNVITKNYDVNRAEFIADKRVENAVKFIKNNISVPITTNDVAKYVYISAKQLGRIFNEHLGQSPAEYIKMEKNKYICKLLSETNLGLSDIAEAVGFPDVASLIKRFKAIEGVTPAKYRFSVKSNK